MKTNPLKGYSTVAPFGSETGQPCRFSFNETNRLQVFAEAREYKLNHPNTAVIVSGGTGVHSEGYEVTIDSEGVMRTDRL